MKKASFWLIILFLAWPLHAVATTPGELLKQAREAYEKGQYQVAIQAWNTLSQIGFVNGDIYNNIASAYWRLGQVGESRLYFLKARELKPRDPEIRENLNFIEEKIGKLQSQPNPWTFLKSLPLFRLSLNGVEALWLSAAASFLLFGAWACYRLKGGRPWLILALAMTVPFAYGLFFLNADLLQRRFAPSLVVLSPKATLFAAPTTDSKSEAEVREGELLRQVRSQGDFVKVRTPDGKEAWIEAKNIGEV